MTANLCAARRAARAATVGLIALIAGTSAAIAQAEDDRMRLFRYYLVHVAIDVCEIDVPAERQKRFDGATDGLERKIGLSQAEMDAGFKQIKAGAAQNPRGFCDTYRPVAQQTLGEFD
jgi:hypothetical protein